MFGQKSQCGKFAGYSESQEVDRFPGSGNPIGGIKVIAGNGWFAARPSGTEDVYKIYAESFRSADHLQRIQHEAQEIVATVLGAVGSKA